MTRITHHHDLDANQFSRAAILGIGVSLVAVLTLSAASSLGAQTAAEATDFDGTGEALVAPTRIAWCAVLSPDETWVAACYGYYRGDVGRLCVWDLKTGKVKWQAREARGIRRLVISPDGSLIASGNYRGEIHVRDAATGELRRMLGNIGSSVEGLCFSSDGRRLVSGGNQRTLRMWDVATGRVLKTFQGHTNVVYEVRFSPDDKRLLSNGADRSARIWNVEDGSQQQVFTHPREVSSATFLSDGKQIATTCFDGRVRVFSADTGEAVTELLPLTPQQAFGTVAASSRDGTLLATGDAARIRIWDTNNWQAVTTLEGTSGFVWGLAFSKDSHLLISSGSDNAVRVWDVPAKRQQQELSLPADEQAGAGPLRAIALSPNGKLLATVAEGSGVHLRDSRTGSALHTLSMQDALAVAFAPDSLKIVVANAGGGVCMWDVESGAKSAEFAGHPSAATSVAWSTNGKWIATGGEDKTIRLWDAATAKQIAVLEGHTARVLAVTFSPDSTRLVSGSKDSSASVWDIEKKMVIAKLAGHAAAVNAVAFTSDGRTIATASNDGTARLWETVSYRQRATLEHQEPITSLAFSPGGQTLATGGERASIRLWNSVGGSQRQQLTGHADAVTGLAFLPDGSALLSGSADESIRLWKAAAPAINPLVMLPAHKPEALSVAYSPDGNWLITGGADKTVAIRDPGAGNIHRVLRGPTSRVTRIAVSPDSNLVAGVSGDGTVRIWSIAEGEQVAMFNAWREKFAAGRAVAFSADGRTLASGADDGTIKLWSIADEKEIRVLDAQTLPITSLAFSECSSLLASATGDWRNNQRPGELRLWEVASGKELARLDGHTAEIKCLAIDKSGKLLASSANDLVVRLWNLADRTELLTIRLDVLSGSLTFSPDGERLAMGHYSGNVTVWDVPEGTLVQRYVGHTKGVPGIAFSPDGQLLATVSTDGTLGLWPASVGRSSLTK
jgi:WD40 repeat protein